MPQSVENRSVEQKHGCIKLGAAAGLFLIAALESFINFDEVSTSVEQIISTVVNYPEFPLVVLMLCGGYYLMDSKKVLDESQE